MPFIDKYNGHIVTGDVHITIYPKHREIKPVGFTLVKNNILEGIGKCTDHGSVKRATRGINNIMVKQGFWVQWKKGGYICPRKNHTPLLLCKTNQPSIKTFTQQLSY